MRHISGGHRLVTLSVRRIPKQILLLPLLLLLLFVPISASGQTTVNIHAIQTNLPNSPYLNPSQTVTTTGIVIAVLSDGFYIENPDASFDGDICTAEGIFVYTPTGVPSNAVLQNNLTVTGLVQPSNSSNYAGTQIYIASPNSTNVVTNSTGNTLPTAISASVLTNATGGTCALYPAGTFGQWLPFEGMRANVPSSTSLLVTEPTGGTTVEATQTVTTNGQFWAVLASSSSSTTRPFRATGISMLENVPAGAPSTVTRWAGNPQLLLVDTKTLGGTAINATAGTLYTGSANLIGVIDYHVSTKGYTGLLLTSDSVSSLTASNTITPTAAAAPNSGVLTIATQDLGRFFDTSSSISGAIDITSDAFARRVAKVAMSIVSYENIPDIVAVQEVESQIALQALSTKISALASTAGKTDPAYTAIFFTSNDSTGLGNGVLVRGSVIDTILSEQYGKDATYTKTDSSTALLFDRPPIVLHVGVIRSGTSEYPLTILVNNMLDRTNIDDATLGAEVRNKREKQAEYIGNLIQVFQSNGEHVISVGNYNSFEFSDGFVDTMGIIDGNPVSSTLVTLTGPSNLTHPNLVNLTTSETSTKRYTYVENGSAEQPDHILITSDIQTRSSIDYARVNADFPLINLNDATTAVRNADHDPLIGYFVIPQKTNLVITSSENPSYFGDSVTFTATASSVAGGIPTGTISFYDGTTLLGTATLDANGVATYTTSSLAVGTHKIIADYPGDLAHDPATASLFQVVLALTPTQTILACSPNPALYGTTVTCTATVSSSSGTPTGAVTFFDGTTALGTSTLSGGVGSFSTNSLAVGIHKMTAVFARNNPYATSTSNEIDELIYAEFSISVTPTSRSIYTGEATTYTVTVTPGAGFNTSVSLSCSTLPNASSCTFNPSSVSSSNWTSTWTIQTSAPAQSSAANHQPRLPWQIPAGSVAMAGVALFFVPKRFRRRGLFLAILSVIALNTMIGCSSPRSLVGGTTPGTYTVTVTGTADESGFIVSHSATTTLTVKTLF